MICDAVGVGVRGMAVKKVHYQSGQFSVVFHFFFFFHLLLL